MKWKPSFKRIIQQSTSVDQATFAYLFLTGMIILFGYGRVEQAGWHLLARIVVFTVVFWMIAVSNTEKRWLKFIRDFYPLLLFSFFYTETDALNNLLFQDFDPVVAHWEERLFGGQPSLLFSTHFPQVWFAELMHFAYFSFYLMILGLCLYLWLKNPGEFQRSLFLITFSFYLYYLLFIVFPVAGPQFYFPYPENAVPQGWLFGRLMHVVHQLGERPTAAFPSSHVGIAALVCFLTARYARPLLKFLLPLFVLLCLSTVYLKAHYLVDVIGGMTTLPIFTVLGFWMYRKVSTFNKNGTV
jgi:membrane-associated phospholipid phosphatase